MAIDGPEPTEGFPEGTSDTVAYTGLSSYDARISDLFHFGQRVGIFRPYAMIGTGSNPLNWEFQVGHGSNVSGDESSQQSTFNWSSSTVTVTVSPTIVSDKLRLTFSHQVTSGGSVGANWLGCCLFLRRSMWAGFTLAASGINQLVNLPFKPAVATTMLASGAITALTLTNPVSQQRALQIDVVSGGGSVYVTDLGTQADNPIDDNDEDGFGLFIGKPASLITGAASSIVIDVTLPGGSAQTSASIQASDTRTDPASGGQFTTISWDNAIDSQCARDFTADAPHRAGDLGRITKTGPDLYYGGKRVYLWGYNLAFTACTGCTSGQMIAAAQKFSQMGMTLRLCTDPETGEEFWSAGIIRFHHIDANNALNSGGQHSINSTALSNMFYFINVLAEYGIFSTIDLHSMYGKAHPENNATKANSILSGATTISAYHALVYFGLGNARADAATYITELMTTVSPYSGMDLATDPAIAYVHYFNEEVPPHDTDTPNNDAQGSTAEKAAINALFQAIDGQDFDWDRPAHATYCVAAATGYLTWCDGLMDSVGYTGLTASLSNFQQGIPELEDIRLGLNRSNHIEPRHRYWNIPYTSSPYTAHQKPPGFRLPASDPLSFFYDFGDRPDGTCPMVLDEWNCVYPFDGAGEEDLIVSAVAAVRGWGGIIKFDYAASVAYLTTNNVPAEYSVSGDPMRVVAGVAMRNIYGRRDVRPLAYQEVLNEDDGWIGVTEFAVNPWGRQFRINSPRSKAFAGHCGASQTLGHVGIELRSGDRQVVYITSKDDRPIEHASTILILHITKQIRGGTVWTSPRRTAYSSIGTGPVRIEQATARIELSVSVPTRATIYPLDSTGTRGQALMTQLSDSKLVFDLDNRTTPTLAYEIDIDRLYGMPTGVA